MILDGLIIMIVGMLVVFFFLILIVLAMRIMSAVVLKYFPEKEIQDKPARKADDSEIAAAVAAVKAYIR
jgi:oxaloacetate decarboxylase gamma subunit